MKSSPTLHQQSPEGCLNSELWHACSGPLLSLPSIGSHVVYFPQGHSEQVAASTNNEADSQISNYPTLLPQLICHLHNVTMHADIETDEVYAQMTLQPLSPQEQKEVSFLPADLGSGNKQPTNYFCKTLTASDTSTHGGFSVPRRAAEKVFPPLDFSMQPPAQELIARDLHNNEWKFRHIFRGQPKRHLLTTGWSVFVSAKRLVAGDSVLFIWNDKNQLLLGIRRANRPQTVMPLSVLSSDSMHLGLLAAAAHAAATNSRFTIFYNPRASPSEFVIPFTKYIKAIYHTRVSVGMRFRMLFETEESSVRRYMGTITGISDVDSVRWTKSHWRSVKVGWDESTVGERQPRVSLWEIEPVTTFPMYSSPFDLRLKRPWPPGLPSFTGMKNEGMGMNSPLMWDQGMQCLNQGMGPAPWMQPMFDSPSFYGMQNDIYQSMATSKRTLPSILQYTSAGLAQPQMIQQFQQSSFPFLQSLPTNSITHLQQHQNSFIDNNSQMSSNSQALSQSVPSIPTLLQNFPEPSVKPIAGNINSPLHTFLRSTHSDDDRGPTKRLALDPLLSNTSMAHNSVSLPPFPGREDQDVSNDPQNNFSYGVNIDSSLYMHNGMSNFKGVGRESDDMTMGFATSTYTSGSAAGYSLDPSSNCIDDSGFLPSSHNVGHTNPTKNNAFVKVYKGSFGRSIDLTEFSSYHELRSKLGEMFGLQGQLEDPLRSGWQLVFVDREDDVLLLGDDPWPEFVSSVWCIKILSPQEVNEMRKQGLELLNNGRLPNGSGCDDYSNRRQETRNMIPVIGTLDF